MQYTVHVNGRPRQVTIERRETGFLVALDGRSWDVDAAFIGPHVLSLLLRDGAGGTVVVSREVSLAVDPVHEQVIVGVGTLPVPAALEARRRSGRTADGPAGSGPQRILAPMPGKIVRVLVRPGDVVQPRHPLVVVEAMKMENELRATRDGTVADVLVQEGQSVEAGTLLVVVAAP